MGNVGGCCRSSAAVYPGANANIKLIEQRRELEDLRDQVRGVKVALTRSVEVAALTITGLDKHEAGEVRFQHRRSSSQARISAKWMRDLESDIAQLTGQIDGSVAARELKLKTDAQKIRQAMLVANDMQLGLKKALTDYEHRDMAPIMLPPAAANAASLLPFGVSVDIKLTLGPAPGAAAELPISAASILTQTRTANGAVYHQRAVFRPHSPRPSTAAKYAKTGEEA